MFRLIRHQGMGVSLAMLLAALFVNAGHAQTSDVTVEAELFGVGSVFRPGSYVGVRFTVTMSANAGLGEGADLWIQWEIPNADGDIAQRGRRITATPGRPTSAWIYAPLPPDLNVGNSVWSVRVFDFADSVRGRELGGARFSPAGSSIIESDQGAIGLIGNVAMGLTQYMLPAHPAYGSPVFTAHEDTRIATGIRPADLPDRWEGLEVFDVLVWGKEEPSDLTLRAAEALREWVRRGGHFIISLPQDGNAWGIGEEVETEFGNDLFPTQRPRVDEAVPLTEILPIASKAEGFDERTKDNTTKVQVFRDLKGDFNAIDNHYVPLLALNDGRVVVVQRTFGHGHITLIGVDFTNASLNQFQFSNRRLGGMPQADVFWNRILGRRQDTPQSDEIIAAQDQKRLRRSPPREVPGLDGTTFTDRINMSGEAAKGLLLALLLFVAYWVVAGPGGFVALKQYKRVRHSWLAFAAAAGVFTAIAWGGVALIRQDEVQAKHVTVLDHIARKPGETWNESDPQLQRAVSWLSLHLPGYGTTRVGIESLEAQPRQHPAMRDLLSSWEPPGKATEKFPDVDRYTIDVAENVDEFALPTRSTATQLYANWLGAVDPQWGGMPRVHPDDPLRVEIVDGREVLKGRIIHDLPGSLRDVKLLWIQNNPVPVPRYIYEGGRESEWRRSNPGGMVRNGRAWSTGVWDTGTAWTIDSTLGGTGGATGGSASRALMDAFIQEKYITPYEDLSPITTPILRFEDRVMMLSMFQQLTPPKYSRLTDDDPASMRTIRRVGRELDLSVWFTRPCVIVIGFLDNSACPIPLRVEGRPINSDGVTVVRWILPLDINEEIAFPNVFRESDPAAPAGGDADG